MAKCEVGDHRSSRIKKCRECGAYFCDKHGNTKKRLCQDCEEYVESDREEFDDVEPEEDYEPEAD